MAVLPYHSGSDTISVRQKNRVFSLIRFDPGPKRCRQVLDEAAKVDSFFRREKESNFVAVELVLHVDDFHLEGVDLHLFFADGEGLELIFSILFEGDQVLF